MEKNIIQCAVYTDSIIFIYLFVLNQQVRQK